MTPGAKDGPARWPRHSHGTQITHSMAVRPAYGRPGAGAQIARIWLAPPDPAFDPQFTHIGGDARLVARRPRPQSVYEQYGLPAGPGGQVRGGRRVRRCGCRGWQAGRVEERRLPGGFVTRVVRAGDTVRREQPPDPAFVHALLGWFERCGWDGAPRFLGTDERGREVLSFVERPPGDRGESCAASGTASSSRDASTQARRPAGEPSAPRAPLIGSEETPHHAGHRVRAPGTGTRVQSRRSQARGRARRGACATPPCLISGRPRCGSARLAPGRPQRHASRAGTRPGRSQ